MGYSYIIGNALVHRAYMGAMIQMRVYDNKLSIWNEGTLPYGLSLDDLRTEHNSRPRNPVIANACFLGGYIDTWGRGTLKIISSCKDAGLPEPEIKEMNGGVEVTLFAASEKRMSEEHVHETPVKTPVKTPEAVLTVLRGNPSFTLAEVADTIGKSVSAVERAAQKLKDQGLLKFIGPQKGGHWEVSE